MTVINLVDSVAMMAPRWKQPLVVITGGEPFRQPIGLLCHELVQRGFQVQVETNGKLRPDPFFLTLMNNKAPIHVVISPKTNRVNEFLVQHARAFKYVLDARSLSPADGLPIRALDHPTDPKGVARPPLDFARERVYVNPCDVNNPEQNARNVEAVVQVALAHGYTLGLQIHKLIGLP